MSKRIFRQGDLTFIFDGAAEAGPVSPPAILARGEESGHWHTLVGGTVHREGDGRYVVNVPGPAPARVVVEPATHAERHEPIELPPGRWVVPGVADRESIHVGQREYVPRAVPRPAGD